MKAIIFDIDGTLSDPTHRLHHVTGGRKDWDAFFAAMADDPCHEPIADLCAKLRYAHEDALILCSGRPERYREVTETWLRKMAGISRWDALYMRPDDDHRPDHIVKVELLARMRADGYEPWLAVDDRPTVVAMWRANGITCLQCRDWDRQGTAEPGLLTLMVGPTGAGKTSWLTPGDVSNRLHALDVGIRPHHVVSSDRIWADLCGDFRDQSRNDEVFAALHAVVEARVRRGLPAVVDATNLRRKDRFAVVSLTPPTGRVRYIVLDRPMEEKMRDAGWRAEVPGLIERHAQTFASQLRDILAGDGLPNVEVIDLRRAA